MDLVQTTIVIISFALTVLIVVLSIQVWHILKEMRLSIHKANKMLDDFGGVTGKISESVSGMAGLLSGLKAGLSLFSGFRKSKDDDNN